MSFYDFRQLLTVDYLIVFSNRSNANGYFIITTFSRKQHLGPWDKGGNMNPSISEKISSLETETMLGGGGLLSLRVEGLGCGEKELRQPCTEKRCGSSRIPPCAACSLFPAHPLLACQGKKNMLSL